MNNVLLLFSAVILILVIGILNGASEARERHTVVIEVCIDGVKHRQTTIADRVTKLEPLYNQGELVLCTPE